MAISFQSISKGIGLYDFIQFGKYKGCRADSILAQDPEYITYTKEKFGTLYAQEVLEQVEGSMATYAKAKELAERAKLAIFKPAKYNPWTHQYADPNEDWFAWQDDVPF